MIILASNSPHKKRLMEKLGIEFVVEPSNYEEDHTLNFFPTDLAIELSRGKALDVASRHDDAIVIGADTIVDFNGEIIGKHYNRENAIKALTKLNNTSHSVITAYTIIDTKTGKTVSKAITSTVTFKNNSPEDIEKYVDLDKPFDKAGYAIEDPHFNLALEINGDEDAIIGLPVKDLALDLKQFGINVL